MYAIMLEGCDTKEKREALEQAMAWPVEERDLRAGWGMGPEAEAGQAAMMSFGRQ